MKKLLSMLAITTMLLTMLTGCGSSSDQTTSTTDTGSAAASEQTTEDNATESSSTLASYSVEIKGAKLCEDYEGNPAIMITYSWTNGSEETTSPLGSMMPQAFQDGVELEVAIVDFEYNDGFSDVRPGTTIEVDAIYEMTSESVVEFELSAIEDIFLDPVPMVTADFDPTTLEHK